jgi:hypothetical protein
VNKQGLVAGLIALVAVAALLGGILFSTRHNKVELKGEILKVRSHQLDAEHTVAVLDLRLTNPSTQQFMVKDVEVYVDDPGGAAKEADVFSDIDGLRVLEYYKVLGKRYNPSLIRRDKFSAGQSADRTLMINVPMTDEQFAKRKRLRVVIHDADGPTTEVAEAR